MIKGSKMNLVSRTKISEYNKKGKLKECLSCKKEFWCRPSWLLKRKYCDRNCYQKLAVGFWKGKHLPEDICRKISKTNRKKGIRPPECPEVWATRTREKMLIARRTLGLKKPTRPEKKMSSFLDGLGIKHLKQHLLFEKFIVDELLPDINIVIEVNGRYWHSSSKQVSMDKGRYKYLSKAGYKVLPVWDDQLDSFFAKYKNGFNV